MKELSKIIADVFEIDVQTVNDESGPHNIEKWDSMGQLALIGALENHYRITLEVEEIFEIFKVGDIKRILVKKGVLAVEN
jgi:acyl carrier protein